MIALAWPFTALVAIGAASYFAHNFLLGKSQIAKLKANLEGQIAGTAELGEQRRASLARELGALTAALATLRTRMDQNELSKLGRVGSR